MAYVLLHTLQKQVLKGSEYANATMKTIQNRIIKTAAWVKEMRINYKNGKGMPQWKILSQK